MHDNLQRALNSLHQGCYDEAAQFCREVLEHDPGSDRALHMLGVIAIQQGRLTDAEQHFRQASAINPADGSHHLNLANVLRAQGETQSAAASYRAAVETQPERTAAWEGWAYATMRGAPYRDLLRGFHDWLQPELYLEIGIESGRTLALAKPPTKAIGIDPQPDLQYPFEAQTRIFEMTSDEFFAAHDVRDEFGPVRLAFLDGLHLFDQTLRDFIHVEQQADPDSVVLIHDCLPLHPLSAQRDQQVQFWTGDTWKVVPILRQFRPDLEVFTVASAPTGLAVVTRLDPASSVLKEHSSEILDEWLARELPGDEDARRKQLAVVEGDFSAIRNRIKDALA
jgi:tetratricopeptide (TPR) repeat protein